MDPSKCANILCADAVSSRSTIMETYMKSNLENNLEAKRFHVFFIVTVPENALPLILQ